MGSYLFYFLPVVVIIGMMVYVMYARKNIAQALTNGQGGQLFHNGYAQYFPEIAPNERIIAVWSGLAYTGSTGSASQVAGAVLNQVSAAAIGVSSYTPLVFVALLTSGRVLIAEEYSEFGTRGHFKTVAAWGPGARAVTGPEAIPGHQGAAPKNPMNPNETLVLATLRAPDGSAGYQLWAAPVAVGSQPVAAALSTVLPFEPAMGAQIWAMANPGAPTL